MIERISQRTLYNLIKSHNRYGYISLETLSTWNTKLKNSETFYVKKQYNQIDKYNK